MTLLESSPWKFQIKNGSTENIILFATSAYENITSATDNITINADETITITADTTSVTNTIDDFKNDYYNAIDYFTDDPNDSSIQITTDNLECDYSNSFNIHYPIHGINSTKKMNNINLLGLCFQNNDAQLTKHKYSIHIK